MNEINYRVFCVNNGQMADFNRGITSRCSCWGIYDTIEEAANRVRELAEEEVLKEGFIARIDIGDAKTIDVFNAISKASAMGGGAENAIVREVIKAGINPKFENEIKRVVLKSGTPDTEDDMGELSYAIVDACFDVERGEFVEQAVESMGFEWDGDLKWIRVAKFSDQDFVEVVD